MVKRINAHSRRMRRVLGNLLDERCMIQAMDFRQLPRLSGDPHARARRTRRTGVYLATSTVLRNRTHELFFDLNGGDYTSCLIEVQNRTMAIDV